LIELEKNKPFPGKTGMVSHKKLRNIKLTEMKKICTIVMIACLVAVSCKKDDFYSNDNRRQGAGKEKLYSIKKVQPLTKAVSVNAKTWNSGDTVKIKFLNGSTQLQDAVKQVAATWLEYAWLKFEYVSSGNADVKIGFDMDTRYISWAQTVNHSTGKCSI
jgi:hypothetical protein